MLFRRFHTYLASVIIAGYFSLSSCMAIGAELQLTGAVNQPLPVTEAFVFTNHQQGQEIDLIWQIASDYYLYQDKIEAVLSNGLPLTDIQMPAAVNKLDPIYGDTQVYYNQLVIKARLPELTDNVDLTVYYQGCWEGGVCYPPQKVRVALQVIPVTAGQLTEADTLVQTNNASWFGHILAQGSFGLVVLTFFLAGLGLSLTPCVLPMVPILSSMIVGAHKKPGLLQSLALSLTYVFSMALTYTLAGIIAGLSGANFQASLQQPWIIIATAMLFLLLAAMMFDWLQLRLPVLIQGYINQLSQRKFRGKFIAVAAMGLLSALVLGPCVAAPLAGALIFIGQTGDPLLGGVALFVMAMGMGVPLVLAGVSAGRLVLARGTWMVLIKHLFGLIMVYMAIWMLDRLWPHLTVPMASIVTLMAAVYGWQQSRWNEPLQSLASRTLVYLLALIASIYGCALLAGYWAGRPNLSHPLQFLTSHHESSIKHNNLNVLTVADSDSLHGALTDARNNQQPAIVDVYADWCISCREFDLEVLSQPMVKQALQNYHFIKLDITEYNDETRDLLQRYRLVGPPSLLFFDLQGNWLETETITGIPTAAAFINKLNKYGNGPK